MTGTISATDNAAGHIVSVTPTGTITVGKVWTLKLDSKAYSYTAKSGDSLTSIGAALAKSVNDDYAGGFNATVSGATLTLTKPVSATFTSSFGVGTGSILSELREAGGDVLGADWRAPIDEAWEKIGPDRGIQGNLDPTLLLGPIERVFAATDDILERVGGRPGHIFNLGHGILPTTPLERVQALAHYVHRQSER